MRAILVVPSQFRRTSPSQTDTTGWWQPSQTDTTGRLVLKNEIECRTCEKKEEPCELRCEEQSKAVKSEVGIAAGDCTQTHCNSLGLLFSRFMYSLSRLNKTVAR